MSKTRFFALLLIAVMVAALLTNPTQDKLESAVQDKATSLLMSQLNYKDTEAMQLGMTLFGNRIVKEFVSNSVIIENYYLFSIIKIRWQGQTTPPIGGGAFTKVWLSPEIDRKADEIVRILKNL
ncbi:hypothetical protein [Sphingobacterium thermophilum]|uniref:DUF4359 domain-containing protein n=1 Tax=Sphingobacterium thermophilum TaxID=768534 RepID=A0ABP8R9U4_9SPHI